MVGFTSAILLAVSIVFCFSHQFFVPFFFLPSFGLFFFITFYFCYWFVNLPLNFLQWWPRVYSVFLLTCQSLPSNKIIPFYVVKNLATFPFPLSHLFIVAVIYFTFNNPPIYCSLLLQTIIFKFKRKSLIFTLLFIISRTLLHVRFLVLPLLNNFL